MDEAPRSTPSLPFVGASLCVVLSVLGVVVASQQGTASEVRPTVLLALVCLSASYGAAIWSARRALPSLVLVCSVGLIARVLLAVFSFPTLSDDIWRYLWDGHLQTQGVHPYVFAPNAPETVPWRTSIWPLINHPEVPTIYPPASQLVFAVSAWLGGGSVVVMRVLIVAAEMSMLWALWAGAGVGAGSSLSEDEKAGRKVWIALLFLYNPLTLVEFSGSGHLDALAIASLVWALVVIRPTSRHGVLQAPTEVWRWALSGGLIAWSISAKLLGFFAVPLIAATALYLPSCAPEFRTGHFTLWRRFARVAVFGLSSLAVLVLTFIPYATPVVFGESAMFGRGFSTYARKWRGNDGAFALVMELQRAVLGSTPHGERAYWRFDAFADMFRTIGMTHVHEGQRVASTSFGVEELAAALTKGWVALLLCALVLFCLHQRTRAFNATAVVLAALLLFAPTVHPWYVAWLVPFGVLLRSKALLLWSVLVFLTYAEGVWGGPLGLRLLEYVPVWVLVVWEVGRRVSKDDPNEDAWLTARIFPEPRSSS